MTPKLENIPLFPWWSYVVLGSIVVIGTTITASVVRDRRIDERVEAMNISLHNLEIDLLKKEHQEELTKSCNSCAAKALAAAAKRQTEASPAGLIKVPQRADKLAPVPEPQIGETNDVESVPQSVPGPAQQSSGSQASPEASTSSQDRQGTFQLPPPFQSPMSSIVGTVRLYH